MAVIYYRFKSQKPENISNIKFDGTGLTVFELKREIIYANKLLSATDVDISIYNAEDPNVQYEDDNEVIQRSSTVLVCRTAASKRGKGNIQRYLTGKPKLVKSVAGLAATNTLTSAPATTYSMPLSADVKDGNEEDVIQKMFSVQDDQWNQQQAVMANATRVDNNKPSSKLDENIPDYYICYKCGEKGKHHIRNCPKNNDPNWEGIRVKKTTGIPKSHLKAIENPGEMINDPNVNYMITDEGKYVVAVADTKAWEKYQKIQSRDANGNDDGVDVDDGELKDDSTGKLWKEPIRTKCCNKVYSRKIIEDLLLDSDFKCPNCGTDDVYLDSLIPDKELQKKVDQYLEERKAKESETSNKRHQIAPVGGNLPQIPMMPVPMPMPPLMPFLPVPPAPVMNLIRPTNNNKNK